VTEITSAVRPAPEPHDLHSNISELTARKNQLTGALPDQDEIRTRLTVRQATDSGFIRKTNAKWLGTDTPANTFESALWALHNRRADALMQLLSPDTVKMIQQQMGNAPEKFFDAAAAIPAMRVSNQQFWGAATIKAELDLSPEDRTPRAIFFFLLDGQWKLALGEDTRFTP
jgi:hypothetical protein